MKFNHTTIKDVAKALGVSASTVSRALSDNYQISESTKKRVQEYSQQINFIPNHMASGLKARKSKSIGVVVSEIANSYFSRVLDGIESIAQSKGYQVMVQQTHGHKDKELESVAYLVSQSVDGLLVSLSPETVDLSYFKELCDKKMPMVFFDSVPENMSAHKVLCDNYQGAYDAVVHLLDHGYGEMAFLAEAKHLSCMQERFAGYSEALSCAGIVMNEDHILYCNLKTESSMSFEQSMQKFMDTNPDSLLVCGDDLTCESIKFFKKNGIRIPEDLAVIYFSNQDFADLFDPPISTVDQPAYEIGQHATHLLFQSINSKADIKKFEYKKLQCQFQERASVGNHVVLT
jgi:LacI family transcriptional regulator